MPDPTYFPSPKAWRDWLEKNHASSEGLFVGLVKKGSELEGLAYPEALDEALCFGWIDGVRKSIDDKRWMIRFSPRKKSSIWSAVNKRHIERLTKEGRMAPAGLAAYEGRDLKRERSYSFENSNAAFAPEEEAEFRAHGTAWSWYEGQGQSYRHAALWWVVSARKAETRQRRLTQLIEDSAAGQRIGPMRRPVAQ
ncbi:MAG: YdeI family protein [Bauldia sp.]